MAGNPDDARLVTSDIDLFWRAYDMSRNKSTEEKIEIYKTEYFEKGSIGLKDFIELRIESAEELVQAIEERPKYYASIRESSNRVLHMTDLIRGYLHNWKRLYEDAVFPDVYFVIGKMSSGGTISDNGLLIGTELFCRTDSLPEDELNAVYLAVLKPIGDIPSIVIHELMHVQQRYGFEKYTLLSQSISEGAADFLGELACGKHINPHVYPYGLAHEAELWKAFSEEMLGDDHSNWLYNGHSADSKPPDLGYFIGYRICEAYYDTMDDKQAAIKDILTIQDARAFLQQSGYGQ